MRTFTKLSFLPEQYRGGVLVLGNFDGVHLGHQALLGDAAEQAKKLGLPLQLLTFEPHPRTFLRPETPLFRLTPLRSKIRVLNGLGLLDHMFILRFNKNLAGLPPASFIEDILKKKLRPGLVMAGERWRFGKDAAGRLSDIAAAGIDTMAFPRRPDVSSSSIRALIEAREFEKLPPLLGRFFEIEGHVVHGQEKAHVLGFPTANILIPRYVQPPDGVYAVRIFTGGAWRPGISFFEERGGDARLPSCFETHVLGFAGDLYGTRARVQILRFLREKKHFSSAEELTAAIASDIKQANETLKG